MTINSLSGEIRTSFRNSGRLREHPKGGVPAEQDYLRSAGGEARPSVPIQRPLSISCRMGDPQTRARERSTAV